MEINDILSGVNECATSIGQALGPIYGAWVTGKIGYRHCCDSVSIICLVYSIVFFCAADGPKAFQTSRW